MTPKEKATDLIDSYYVLLDGFVTFEKVQQCALIAVDEILKAVNDPDDTFLSKDGVDYWEEVKQEIEAL
jgi:hypothetical protein